MVEVAVGGVAASLFGYNRENWMFDRKLRQYREYQGQGMRIKQFELYRDDVRDLVDLTVSKMDNYLIINTLLAGFCVKLFTEGRPKPGLSPSWLHWLYAVCNAGGLMYFMISIWLAMHASIAAHSFGVRLLTQFVRLPVPSKEQIDAARAYAQDFEGLRLRDMMRLPVLRQQLRRMTAAMDETTREEAPSDGPRSAAEDEALREALAHQTGPAVTLEHVQLYRKVQTQWQAYDAYARVCMAMGTNQLLFALSYYCIIMFLAENHTTWPAICSIMVFVGCAWLIIRLDMYLSRSVLRLAFVLLATAPMLAMVAATFVKSMAQPEVKKLVSQLLVPVVFLIHIGWMFFALKLAKADQQGEVALPTEFRSVLYLDVYGWLLPNTDSGPTETGAAGLANLDNPSASLKRLCQEKKVELSRDLDLWEAPLVQQALEAEAGTLRRIEGCRRRFSAVCAELAQVAPGATTVPPPDEGDRVTWLRLTWSQANLEPYYFRWDTGEVSCTPPQGAVRLFQLESLEQQLEEFAGRVRQLGELLQHVGAAGAQAPSAALSAGAVAAAATETGRSPAASSSRSGGRQEEAPPRPAAPPAFSRATTASLSEADSFGSFPLRPDPEEDNPAQETRFGGREAIQLAQSSTLLGVNAEAAATFHPGGRGPDAGTDARDAAVARRPPGQMPWRTFLQGSQALIVVWCFGFGWSCFNLILQVDLPLQRVLPGGELLGAARHPERVAELAPPHAFFGARGLACHEAWGPTLLVHERYAVHALRLGVDASSGTWAAVGAAEPLGWEPALAGCLAEARDFQAEGIGSVSLQCESRGDAGSTCVAVLLGARGRRALRCPLPGVAPDAPAAGGNLTLHGGPWRALAAAEHGAWALQGAAVVELQPREGVSGELLPKAEVSDAEAAAEHLLALGRRALLSLEPGGLLRAWPLARPAYLAWQLPRTVRWSGVCAAGGSLYFVTSDGVGGQVTVWRASLPPELLAGAGTVASEATE